MFTLTLATSVWDQTLEEKARAIEGKLMAPCCWSQPVAQHYSQAAGEIRRGVREMLAAGKSEQKILEYYVANHGERILASPRARGFNLLACEKSRESPASIPGGLRDASAGDTAFSDQLHPSPASQPQSALHVP